jgi:hypothetical protein
MKKLLFTFALLAGMNAGADIVLSNLTEVVTVERKVVTVTKTNALPVATAKAVWTGFSINYLPPAYTQAVYTVSYMLQDVRTKREVPNSRGVARVSEGEVAALATSKGMDFPKLAQGVGALLDEYLKTIFSPRQPPPARTRTIEEQ